MLRKRNKIDSYRCMGRNWNRRIEGVARRKGLREGKAKGHLKGSKKYSSKTL